MKTVQLITSSKKNLQRFFLILLYFSAAISNAQEAQTDIEVIPKVYYTIKVKLKAQLYTISIFNIDKKGGDLIKAITISSFNSKMLNDFIKTTYENDSISLEPTQENNLKQKSDLKFMELVAALYNTSDSGQNIATIKLNKKIDYYKKEIKPLKKQKEIILVIEKTKYKQQFNVIDCQIVFEDGFMKTIIASGKIDTENIKFSNKFAIGITTRTNIQDLKRRKLFNENDKKDKRYILVGNLLKYERIANVETNDYSPSNQVITLFSNRKETLYKTPSTKLFTLNIFSDFAGINQSNPNGLIQTEFSSRINFWTKRFPAPFRGGAGIMTHILPSIEISKFEQNNRFMPHSKEIINDTTSLFYTNPLETYRYSVTKVSTEVNLFDYQASALSIHINPFFGVGITLVKDTIIESQMPVFVDETINSFLMGCNIKFIFNPESKWSFQVISKSTRIYNLNYSFDYYSPAKNELNKPNNWIHSAEFLLAWKTPNNNKLFGRFRFNHEWNNWNNNFSEFQFGYSIYFKSAKIN